MHKYKEVKLKFRAGPYPTKAALETKLYENLCDFEQNK